MTEFQYIQQKNLGIEQILALIANQKKDYERLERTQYVRRLMFAPHEINYSISGNFRLDPASSVNPDPIAPTIPSTPEITDDWTNETFQTGNASTNGSIFTFGNHFYVSNTTTRSFEAYTSQGVRDSDNDFDLTRGFSFGTSFKGSTANANYFFVLVSGGFGTTIYRYDSTGTRQGTVRVNTTNANALAIANNRFYVARNDQVHYFTIPDNFNNQTIYRDDWFRVAEGTTQMFGIAYARNNIFVAAFSSDVVYAFDTEGTYKPDLNIFLDYQAEPRPVGLTYAGNNLYLRDNNGAVIPFRV